MKRKNMNIITSRSKKIRRGYNKLTSVNLKITAIKKFLEKQTYLNQFKTLKT